MFLNEKSLAYDDFSWLECITSSLSDLTALAWAPSLRLLLPAMLLLAMSSHELDVATYVSTIV